MTRSSLAVLLEQEAHNAAAEQIRGGADPRDVLPGVIASGPRYADPYSREAMATFRAIVRGDLVVQ